MLKLLAVKLKFIAFLQMLHQFLPHKGKLLEGHLLRLILHFIEDFL